MRWLGHAESASPDRLTFTDLASAVADAQFVQESCPERDDVKRPVLAAIDDAAPAGTVIASSSPRMLPSKLPGRRTSTTAVHDAIAFYAG